MMVLVFNKGPIMRLLTYFILMITLFYSEVGYAEANLTTLLQNLAKTMPQLMQLVTAFGYVMGMFLVLKGVLELKKYGESRTMMSSTAELKGALVYIFVGAALIYLPTTVNVGMSTFWTEPNPYQYLDEAKDPWSDLIRDIFMVIQLIGTIAFIRGLLTLAKMGAHHGGQQGEFGKAMAFIIGGVFCINIYQFIQVVFNTLALGQQ
jgi:intracellular multiplication protein IcmC